VANKQFKSHLKQLYSEWPLWGGHALTSAGRIKSSSVWPFFVSDHHCMAMHFNSNDCSGFQKVLYIQCYRRDGYVVEWQWRGWECCITLKKMKALSVKMNTLQTVKM
jgi:hypothetical protein